MAPKSIAYVAALIAALPVSALAQTPCNGPRELTPCEIELYDSSIVWEGRAKEGRVQLNACLEKLRVRTSTVINSIVVPPLPAAPTTPEWLIIGGGIVLGFVVGATMGVFLE